MKRKWAKKVKAVSASKAKRQSTTGAAAIGLIISMGASNLILTRPGDSAPAVDALVQEATLSSSPAKTEEAGQVSYANLVEPTTESFSILITPTPLVQLQEAVAELAPSAIEQTEQTRQTQAPIALAKRVDATSMLTDAKTGAILPRRVAATLNRNIPGQTEAQTRNLLQVLRVNRLISQLKHSQTVAIYSKSDEVNRSYKVPAKAGTTEESLLAISEDKSTRSAKQRLLIDRLKQNRPQDSLAKWRYQEWKYSSVAVTQGTETVSSREKEKSIAQTAASLGLLPGGTSAASTRSQHPQQQPATVFIIPPIAANSLATSSSLKFEQERSLLLLQAIVLDSNLPEIGVNPSTEVVTAETKDYRVKAGDTLSAIALRQKMPLVALIKTNHLDDPNRLQINQKLIIPVERSSNSVGLNIDRIETPTSFQAVTPALNPAYISMGGEISDDDSVSASPPPNVEEIQQAQSAAAQQELLGDRYVENLRTDIQKLQQKYHQGLLTAQAKPYANQTSTAPVTAANATEQLLHRIHSQPTANQPINPEFSAERAAKTLQLDGQKQLPVPVRSPGRTVRVRNGVATAPLGTDAVESLRSFQQQNVSPALPPLGGVDNYLPNPTSISAKGFIWPARGKLTSGYGWRWGRMHKGVDIAAPIGTPIMAAAPGVVVKAGWNSGGYGNLVDIQHADGTVTRYGHNKRILVRAGQIVQQGQQISEMGNTGFSTGPHLHFEVHPMGKKAVNPIAYLPR
ncbi:MAG TPA: hypothetical protein DEV81_23880 [Cyanobacteria bacterium UBA11049]|nr:hypothetical protein [Cyanobacteria bacterium UBA11049]